MKRVTGILLAAALLAAFTVLVWQFRFEQAGPMLTAPFEPGLPNWEWKEGPGKDSASPEPGVLSLTKRKGEPMISVERTFGAMPDVRFLRVAMEARWTDARQGGEIRWATARAVIFGKGDDGAYRWPNDHAMIAALGTRDWHREEAVFDLPPDLGNIGFGFQHLGDSGTFQIRNVEISVVRQRAWFTAAAATLTCLWIAWAAVAVLPGISRWRWLRAPLAGMAIIGATWVLVFPQPRFACRPLVGGFLLSKAATSPMATAPETVIPPIPPPVQETSTVAPPASPHPPAVAEPSPVSPPPAPPVIAEPAPEKREGRGLETELRLLKDRFNFLHLVAFGAFGFVLFSLAGTRAWPIAAVIVFASEALPNYQLHQYWDRDDLGDLAVDSLGLILAALAVRWLSKWQSRRSDRHAAANPAELS